jgi:hypothetical protein
MRTNHARAKGTSLSLLRASFILLLIIAAVLAYYSSDVHHGSVQQKGLSASAAEMQELSKLLPLRNSIRK